MRIFKVVRFMPALQRQLLVMVKTMDNVTSFFGLLVLFMFVFSVLGMNIFGCKFCWDELLPDGSTERYCDRRNFDSLLWATVTVFQVLTQEDWQFVMYQAMSQTSYWSALYVSEKRIKMQHYEPPPVYRFNDVWKLRAF